MEIWGGICGGPVASRLVKEGGPLLVHSFSRAATRLLTDWTDVVAVATTSAAVRCSRNFASSRQTSFVIFCPNGPPPRRVHSVPRSYSMCVFADKGVFFCYHLLFVFLRLCFGKGVRYAGASFPQAVICCYQRTIFIVTNRYL